MKSVVTQIVPRDSNRRADVLFDRSKIRFVIKLYEGQRMIKEVEGAVLYTFALEKAQELVSDNHT